MAADGFSLKVWTLAKLVIQTSAWNFLSNPSDSLLTPQILFLH